MNKKKKDIREILHHDIIENVGIGDIRFGMSEEEFLELYDIEKAKEENIAQGPRETGYWFFEDSIQVYFNNKSKLSYIYLQNNFQGKLNSKIGIGSYFGELRALRKDIQFCDDTDSFILGTGCRFQFMLDEDEYPTGEINGEFIAPAWHWHRDFHIGKLDHYKIESFSMEPWDRNNPFDKVWWCEYHLNNWIEPEEKYLEVRYRYP
jgi:hypothetical protein